MLERPLVKTALALASAECFPFLSAPSHLCRNRCAFPKQFTQLWVGSEYGLSKLYWSKISLLRPYLAKITVLETHLWGLISQQQHGHDLFTRKEAFLHLKDPCESKNQLEDAFIMLLKENHNNLSTIHRTVPLFWQQKYEIKFFDDSRVSIISQKGIED